MSEPETKFDMLKFTPTRDCFLKFTPTRDCFVGKSKEQVHGPQRDCTSASDTVAKYEACARDHERLDFVYQCMARAADTSYATSSEIDDLMMGRWQTGSINICDVKFVWWYRWHLWLYLKCSAYRWLMDRVRGHQKTT